MWGEIQKLQKLQGDVSDGGPMTEERQHAMLLYTALSHAMCWAMGGGKITPPSEQFAEFAR